MRAQKIVVKWVGLTILVVGVTGFLLGQVAPSKPTSRASGGVTASTSGRYEIVINPNARADTFLLDTATGKTWVRVQITNAENTPDIWKFQDRVDDATEYLKWSLGQKAISGAPATQTLDTK